MSALGHKRTCAVQRGMSALPSKADTHHRAVLFSIACAAPPWDRETLLSLVRDKLSNLIQRQRSLADSAGDSCQQGMMRRRLDAVKARIYGMICASTE
jgi:hypothetical protein